MEGKFSRAEIKIDKKITHLCQKYSKSFKINDPVNKIYLVVCGAIGKTMPDFDQMVSLMFHSIETVLNEQPKLDAEKTVQQFIAGLATEEMKQRLRNIYWK